MARSGRGTRCAVLWMAGLVALGGLAGTTRAAGRGEPGEVFPVEIVLVSRLDDLKLLTEMDIDIDGVFGTWARAHVLEEEIEKLRGLGFEVHRLEREPIPPEAAPGAQAPPASYHTYETLTAELEQIAADHPAIARLATLGRSYQGRELWAMTITRNPDVQEDEPEVRFIGGIHGDEVVGKEICINLLNLLTDGYGTDSRIRSLVDSTEIWILPSMNPDGTALHQRYNAQYVDLNRDFPDQFRDPVDTTEGRATETQRVMNWGFTHSTDLSGAFHGGVVVANYPYDGTASGSSVYSYAPDDALWVSLSRTYADLNPTMRASNSDPSFTNGICNGADWYVIYGGMQDWNYVWRGAKDITLEISTVKWPPADQLQTFWNENRESMLAFLERVHAGIRGRVSDATTGAPLRATVHVAGSERDTFTDPDVGDFHRLLLPGRYDVEISAEGYATVLVPGVAVEKDTPPTRLDVALSPLDVELQPVAYRVVEGSGGNGALDPGESADLAITLRDLGLAATSVTARLETTGWNASSSRPEAVYPDLIPSASGESLPPHHGVQVSSDVPAGHKLGFILHWTSDQGSGTTDPLFVPVGAPQCSVVASTDVPRAILDRQTTASVLSFPFDREISEVNVYLEIRHTYVGDLHARIVSPSGTPVALHSRSGGSLDDIIGWFDTDLSPAEPLARLAGENANGSWTLQVTDGVPMNTGRVDAWSVEICGRPPESSTPEMKLRDVAKEASGIRLTWWPYPALDSFRVYRSTDPSALAFFSDVTAEDPDPTDTVFVDGSVGPRLYWLVSGVGPRGEGPRGHRDETP